MLHFLESSVLGMWNDAVLPPLSSSLVNSSFGDAETWQQASNPSVEIERINCGSFFGSTLQEDYSDFLQRHFFSSALDSSAEFITGNNGDPMMAKVAAALQPKAVVGERRKRKKQQSPSYQSKRLKKTACSSHKQHHLPRNESETLAGRPLGKVPLRRSQKLGDKITALQQLVSPFGKTDTASVLQEAALSIKFLHEQIRALIAPYFAMRIPEERLQVHSENSSYSTADLRRKGLCLLPTYTITGLMDQPACDHHGYQLPETTMARENGLHFYQRVSN